MIRYSNPIWYGEKWKIWNDHDAYLWMGKQARYSFIHDDYDLDDDRHGHGESLADCIEQIKDYEADHA
jgi:hypothetical protein